MFEKKLWFLKIRLFVFGLKIEHHWTTRNRVLIWCCKHLWARWRYLAITWVNNLTVDCFQMTGIKGGKLILPVAKIMKLRKTKLSFSKKRDCLFLDWKLNITKRQKNRVIIWFCKHQWARWRYLPIINLTELFWYRSTEQTE